MKKLLSLVAIVCTMLQASASTSITTTSVSGHWTTSGSPYLIYNNIRVDASASLTIDPGVSVIFQGPYVLNVAGIIHAAGTASQKVNFTINDTTGFHSDVTSNGGWHGIQILAYTGGAPDTSALTYCAISCIKIDSTDYYSSFSTSNLLSGGLSVSRTMSVKNCDIFQCKTVAIAGPRVIEIETNAGQTFNMANCNIYNNTTGSCVFMDANLGDSTYIHENSIHDNYSRNGIVYICTNFLFENNDVFANTSYDGIVKFLTSSAHKLRGVVRGNKIHDNENDRISALSCYYADIDIYNNFIANNQHVYTEGCGAAYGGGGLRLDGNDAYYYVHNNIIANNYAKDNGGGIYIYMASASITNNTIINNQAPNGSAMTIYNTDTSLMIIKNNIITGNLSTTPGTGYDIISGGSNNIVHFGHNYTEHPLYMEVNLPLATFTTDTATNIIGSAPGLVAPTLTPYVSETATGADFKLSSVSPCVDKGDTAEVGLFAIDFAGHPRLRGAKIDIGAYEYSSGILGAAIKTQAQEPSSVYPNPASNFLVVSVPGARGVIELQDISGKTVIARAVNNTVTTLDVHTLPKGIYFAVWNDGAGAKASQKVIVE